MSRSGGADPPPPGESGAGARTTLRAHAKVNPRLRVLQREEAGYHALESLFARLDLHDLVTVERGGAGIELDVTGDRVAGVPDGRENLCWRAATAYGSAAGGAPPVRIALEKRIPAGSGLGGASADAAAVLRALERLSPRPLGERRLVRIAGELGSDVPFALLGVPMALGWERGRRLLPLQPPPVRPGLVALPPFGVSTRAAYGWVDDERGDGASAAEGGDPAGAAGAMGAAALPGPRRLVSWEILARLAVNDFESVVFARHPELGAARLALEAAGALVARLSGSGSALFGVFADARTREAAVGALAEAGCGEGNGWVALRVRLPV